MTTKNLSVNMSAWFSSSGDCLYVRNSENANKIEISPADEIKVIDFDIHAGQPLSMLATNVANKVVSNISVMDDEKIRELAEEQIRMIQQSESKSSASEHDEPQANCQDRGFQQNGFVRSGERRDNDPGFHGGHGQSRNNNSHLTSKFGQLSYQWNRNGPQSGIDQNGNEDTAVFESGFGQNKFNNSGNQSRCREPFDGSFQQKGFVRSNERRDNDRGCHGDHGQGRNNHLTSKRGKPRYPWNRSGRQPGVDRNVNKDTVVSGPGFGQHKFNNSRNQNHNHGPRGSGGRRNIVLPYGASNNKRKRGNSIF